MPKFEITYQDGTKITVDAADIKRAAAKARKGTWKLVLRCKAIKPKK
jgi:hypothetical protein